MREKSVALDDIIRHLAAIEQLRIDLVMQSGGGNQATAAGGDG